jgi:excinuclease ABC subunit C
MSKTEAPPDPFSQKLADLPPRPGVPVSRQEGDALYIGKAKSLRSRVRSYFQARGTDARGFIPLLRRHVSDLETIVTGTEKEAAILENSLIKQNRPRYNVKLRDDKEYLTLRLDERHPWPRLDLVRRPDADGARYFGPYHSATAARRTLHLVEKHFQLRTCSDRDLTSRKRPCLQFQIKRCPAPCVYDVDRDLYAQQVRAVSLFLDAATTSSRGAQARMRSRPEHGVRAGGDVSRSAPRRRPRAPGAARGERHRSRSGCARAVP